MGLMSEYINKRMSAKELENELLGLIGEYNRRRDTYLFVYAGAIGKPIPDIPISMDDYYIIFDILKDIEVKKLDFYIETPGGSGEAVEEIVRFLRSKFDNINFVISGEAKSAGTILALSGNDILMTKSGSLGPIDTQIKIGRTVISAYDYIEWINQKREEAEKYGKLNPLDATMIAQISPGELSLVYHALKFAEDLVVEWLSEYKFQNWRVTETRKIPVTEEMKKRRAREIANELMNHAKWRTHGRSIKIEDLESIGLKITRIDDYPDIADIVYRIQTVIRLLFSTTTTYKIFATADEKIFKQAVAIGSPPKIPIKSADVAEFEIKCPQCGKVYKLYAKFVENPQIDSDFQKKGSIPFPKDNKLICDCGFEIDLTEIRNDIETRIGKKILT